MRKKRSRERARHHMVLFSLDTHFIVRPSTWDDLLGSGRSFGKAVTQEPPFPSRFQWYFSIFCIQFI